MLNPTLPTPLSPVAAAPAPARPAPQPGADEAAFSQTLNREMAQRQNPPAAEKPDTTAAKPTMTAPPADPPPGPVRAIKHLANVDNAAAPASPAAPADDATAVAADPADDPGIINIKVGPGMLPAATPATAAAVDDTAAAAGAAAAAPMSDMLALVASYQKLLQGGAPAATPAVKTDAGAKETAATGLAADTHTLAALQRALKNTADTGKDTALAAATSARSGAAQPDTALASLRDAATASSIATAKDTAPVTGSAFQAQLASAEMVQTAVTPASDHIPARLGSTAWDNQVSQKVVWMVGGLDQTASLTLNPPDLGPVQVVLNVNNDQATVAFSSATPEVREALENAMPRLRDMMSDAGITLGDASVSANLPDQRQADTSGAGNGANGSRQGSHGGGNGGGVRRGESDIPLPRSASRTVRADGAVDTFA